MTRIAFACAVEIRLAFFDIPRQQILRIENRRPAQRAVKTLADEMRKLFDLRFAQLAARRAALRWMSFLQKRPKVAAVTIAPHHVRTNQIGAFVSAAGRRAVAVNTLRRPDCAPSVSGDVVYDMFIVCAGAQYADGFARRTVGLSGAASIVGRQIIE